MTIQTLRTTSDLSSLLPLRSFHCRNKHRVVTAIPSPASSNFCFHFCPTPLLCLYHTFPYDLSVSFFASVGFSRLSIRCSVSFRPCIDIHKVQKLNIGQILYWVVNIFVNSVSYWLFSTNFINVYICILVICLLNLMCLIKCQGDIV